ncbi:MAG: hypothetical protein RIR94_1492 [Bacteroidota bacterium]|jgi:uncharacterized protein with HEPN domain
MQPEELKYLYDVQTSIQSIKDFTIDIKSFQDFDNNKLVKRAVERELEIIGEAINRLLKMNNSIQITNARKIVNLRNWVIHSYDNVDSVIIWAILQKDLPLLETEVSALLNA